MEFAQLSFGVQQQQQQQLTQFFNYRFPSYMSIKKATMQEDGVSNGNTEDELISSGTSTETVNSKNKNSRCFEKKKGRCKLIL